MLPVCHPRTSRLLGWDPQINIFDGVERLIASMRAAHARITVGSTPR